MARKAKHEKLMFLDSDIAPMNDVDWFSKLSNALDGCLLTQGFSKCNMLAKDERVIKEKLSYTHIFTNNLEVQLNI